MTQSPAMQVFTSILAFLAFLGGTAMLVFGLFFSLIISVEVGIVVPLAMMAVLMSWVFVWPFAWVVTRRLQTPTQPLRLDRELRAARHEVRAMLPGGDDRRIRTARLVAQIDELQRELEHLEAEAALDRELALLRPRALRPGTGCGSRRGTRTRPRWSRPLPRSRPSSDPGRTRGR